MKKHVNKLIYLANLVAGLYIAYSNKDMVALCMTVGWFVAIMENFKGDLLSGK